MIAELRILADLLPGVDEVWLCAIYGSAARGALGPSSDIDVVGDRDDEALEAWRLRAEEAIGREVSVSSIPYMTRVAERRRRPRLAE